jgi:thioredoxin reductase (NADPH)
MIQAYLHNPHRVKLYGQHNSASAYEIRDFLKRSVVEFDWIELTSDRELSLSTLSDIRLPVVEFPDGTQLFAPTIREIAQRLGWVTQPKFKEYDLSIYGAGASEAPLCGGEHVFIVGGGNSAGQAAMYLSRYAEKVTMLIRGDTLAATLSQYLVERITQKSNIEVLFQAQVTGLAGETSLQQIEVTNRLDRSVQKIDTRRLFVCIGGAPNTEWAKDTAIIRDRSGYLITGSDLLKEGRLPECWTLERDPFFLETSVPGSFAAGDVRHGSVKRVASAVGEGAMAVTFVHKYLEETR